MKVLDIVDGKDVFVSSTPDGIDCSKEWFEAVVENLKSADALVVLITPHP